MIAVTLLLIASLTGSTYSQCYSLVGNIPDFYTCIGIDVFQCTSTTAITSPLQQVPCNTEIGKKYGGSSSKTMCYPGQSSITSVCQAPPPACTREGLNPVVLGSGNSLTCNLFVNCVATNAAGTTFTQKDLQSCPAGQNFNPVKKACETGYVCTSATTPAPSPCSPLSKEIDPTTCRGYRFCTLARQWVQVGCLLGLRYDPVLRMCKLPSLVQCNGRPE